MNKSAVIAKGTKKPRPTHNMQINNVPVTKVINQFGISLLGSFGSSMYYPLRCFS